MDVGAWLRGLGLEEYAQAFADNGVDTALLPELSNEDLKDLGVARLADRKCLLKAIAVLSDGDGGSQTQPSSSVPSEAERWQLTVMFCDLVGSTEVSARLDRNPDKMRLRRETVEHPFGTIKARMGATHFLMKRLRNVATEMALHVLVYNLTRVMNILGIKPLMAAMRE